MRQSDKRRDIHFWVSSEKESFDRAVEAHLSFLARIPSRDSLFETGDAFTEEQFETLMGRLERGTKTPET